MRSCVIGALVVVMLAAPASDVAAGKQRSVRSRVAKQPPVAGQAAELPGCVLRIPAQLTCFDGEIGDGAPSGFASLSPAEVETVVKAALSAVNSTTPISVGVVDRTGRPLAVYQQNGATIADADQALGVARTAAFFSNSQAPLSSRTIRFISQVHFPPGLTNASSGALYGIEQSNRGCDLNVQWNGIPADPKQCVVRARSIAAFIANRDGLPEPLCDSTGTPGSTAGCGAGLVTGKIQPDDPPYPQTVFNRPVRAGGIPLYRVLDASRASEGIVSRGKLLGAVGVVGVTAATPNPDLDEFAAVTGAFAAPGIIPLPSYPLPDPQNVFIEGIRLPFLGANQKLRFNSNGLPLGLERPEGTTAGTANGTFLYGPYPGGCAPNGYLAGPYGSTFPNGLTAAEVGAIVQRSVDVSKRTRAQVRLPLNSYARMVITVVDIDGRILAHFRMADALFDAVDVVPAKARNVVWFNTAAGVADLPGVPAGTWVSTRTIGFGSQPFYPSGIDGENFNPRRGPWYSTLYLNNVSRPCSQGSQPAGRNQNGVTFFAGATPLVRNGTLVGGLGVSGDGIEQDDYVTLLGAGEFLPPQDRWADQIKLDGARLPMFKYPRQPQGVTECGGGPCS